MSKKRNFRRRRRSSESDSDLSSDEKEQDNIRSIVDGAKELHKLRKRPHGVSPAGLAYGKRLSADKSKIILNDDPFKSKTGGYVDMKSLARQMMCGVDPDALGKDFASGTNKRDDESNMLRYVEQELRKRRGIAEDDQAQRARTLEDVLETLPEHLKDDTAISVNEEMLSDQILGGIPEVDLGIEAKIRNVEATEEAKAKLVKAKVEARAAGDETSDFVPSNMAVNFVQHNRYNFLAPTIVKPATYEPKVGDVDDYLDEDGVPFDA